MNEITKELTEGEKQHVIPNKMQNWREEAHIDLRTLKGEPLRIARIIYVGDSKDKSPSALALRGKRCISITKNYKTVAFDAELGHLIAKEIWKLSEGFVPKELEG